MKHTAAFLLLCAFLMGCDAASNPFADGIDASEGAGDGEDADEDAGDGGLDGADDETGDEVVDNPLLFNPDDDIPDDIKGDIANVVFDADAGTLVVTGLTLDETPIDATYTRAPALDKNGFLAYTAQDSSLDRHFTAFVAQGTSVTAFTAGSPLPRNRTFKGAFFDRDGAYDPPEVTATAGLVTYSGTYVGVVNSGGVGSDLISTTITPTVLQPIQSFTTQGDVLINADFADNNVEGNIFNRELQDTEGNLITELPSIVLITTDIDQNGSFTGNVEYDILDPRGNTDGAFIDVGAYAGVFGGEDASEIAGGIDLTEFDGRADPLGFENELESGAFILNACTPASTDPVCQQLP
ncbi:MAG: thymidylate synthase [Pseudomonadota bacterium]